MIDHTQCRIRKGLQEGALDHGGCEIRQLDFAVGDQRPASERQKNVAL